MLIKPIILSIPKLIKMKMSMVIILNTPRVLNFINDYYHSISNYV